MNADGSGLHSLTRQGREPAWSPDGRSIAFLSDRAGNWDIFLMDPDGRNQRNLTHTPINEGSSHIDWPSPQLAWSHDNTRIVFEAGWRELFVINADGTRLRQLTPDDKAKDYDPVWSPDDKKIAFVSERDGNTEIYVMDADGGHQRNISSNPADDQCPAWAPG